MAILDMFRTDPGNKAYRAHVKANRLNDSGKLAEAEEQYKKAYELYQAAEEKGFDSPKVVTGFCILLMRLGQFEKARAILTQLTDSGATSTEDNYLLQIDCAVCDWKMGKLDEAMEMMELLGNSRKVGIYYNVLGAMHVEKAAKTGDLSAAAEFMQTAMDYDDDDISAINNMGWLLYHSGKQEEALKYFKQAVEKNARYSPALTGLAAICLDKGKLDKAKDFIDRALAVHFPTTSPITRAYAEELKSKIG